MDGININLGEVTCPFRSDHFGYPSRKRARNLAQIICQMRSIRSLLFGILPFKSITFMKNHLCILCVAFFIIPSKLVHRSLDVS
jgi:hypothetical protein